jgi:hypothetical protein
VRPNTRIVGGIKSVPHSWPSQVLIVQSYKGYYDLRPLAPSNKTLISVEFRCGGTLIDLNTVVSAAHCVIKEFDYYIFGYVYSLRIKLNEFYPTIESMFSIYLGVHETSFLKTNEQLSPTVSKLGTSKIILVIISDLLLKFFSYRLFLQIKHPNFNSFNYQNDISLLRLSYPAKINSFVKVACIPDKNIKNFPEFDQDCYASGN